jgi:hypothetical protein
MQITNISLAAALLAVGVMFSSQPAYSQLAEYTVAQLLEPCMEGDNDSRWGAAAEAECEQYILGFTDAYVLTNARKQDKVCLPPEGNRADEIRWVFMKWAHDNYDKRQLPAALGLLQAIKSKFACK